MASFSSFIIILIAHFFFFMPNDFQGTYHSTIQGQEVYFKLIHENELAILEFLDGKQNHSRYQGVIKKDSVVFSKVNFQNGQLSIIFWLYDSKMVVDDGTATQEIRTNKLTNTVNLKLANIPKLLKNNLDPNLIGSWIYLYSKDGSGKVIENEFAGKNYLTLFSENGSTIIEARAFRDSNKKFGINDFSYNDMPTLTWKTDGDKLMKYYKNPQGSSHDLESTYLIKNDTLFTVLKQGNTDVYLRKKEKGSTLILMK